MTIICNLNDGAGSAEEQANRGKEENAADCASYLLSHDKENRPSPEESKEGE